MIKKVSDRNNLNSAFGIAIPYKTTMQAILLYDFYYFALMIGDGAMVKIYSVFSSFFVTFFEEKIDGNSVSYVKSLC